MSTVTKPFTFSPNTTILSSQVNSCFDILYNDYNGGITNSNVSASAGIVGSKFENPLKLPGKIQLNNTAESGGYVNFDATESNTPSIVWGNSHSPSTTDAAISAKDAVNDVDLLFGANLYYNSAGTRTRFDTARGAAAVECDAGSENVILYTLTTGGVSTSTTFAAEGGVPSIIHPGFIGMSEIAAPATPGANSVRIYAVDNGAGKTQLMALFSSGAAQQMAIQP